MRTVAGATVVAVLTAVGYPRPVMAADVPVTVQLALFEKIWKLDRNFKPGQKVVLAVLFQETYETSNDAKAAVQAWANANNVHCVTIAMDDKRSVPALETIEADVFYITPMRGADIARIASVARARDIRTMAGLSEYVAIGLSIGVSVRNDRPLILVNLDAARAEGAAYQAQLLQLAEIVKSR